jgi:streptothricin acetyltransferase
MIDMPEQIEIHEVDSANARDIYAVDSTFEIRSRVVPSIENGIFTFTIVETSRIYDKSYPDDPFDYTEFINNPDKVAYLAYLGHQNIGQIIIKRWWNRFAWIDDIRVSRQYRKAGIGKVLMDTAVNWTRRHDYPGIMLETQDINVPACLFYQNYGFTLGGVDKMLYRASLYPDETALFWYLVLNTI